MLTLYYKPTCPFCQRVLGEAEDLGVKLNLKDISADETLTQELIDRGGKRMVPYLADEDKGKEMYESGDIIDYLKENYGTKEGHIHRSDEVCDSCQ